METLVLDNNKEIILHLKRIFKKHNYKMDFAYTLEQAKHLLNIKNYDIILLDYHLDGECGLKLIPFKKDSKVILCTSLRIDHVDGIDNYLEKPFETIKLINLLKKYE